MAEWYPFGSIGSLFYLNDDHTMEKYEGTDKIQAPQTVKAVEENKIKAHKEFRNDRVDVNELSESLAINKSLLDQLDSKNNALYKENLQLKRDKESLEKEKDEALSRLSKLAGQKLTKGNPQITDLSDPNRPAKIGERWGSLYTDEWTDAYEDLVKCQRNEDELLEKRLLSIVDWCYKKCSEIAENQDRVIKEKLWDVVRQIHFLGLETDIPIENKRINGSGFENTTLLKSMEVFLETGAVQRQHSPCLNDSVKNKCTEDYCKSNPLAFPSERSFVEKCSELCWVMCSSDPPMVLEYKNFEGHVLDTVKFHKYNRTGTNVEYIVWPTLLLHINGPVLAKGTAQTNDKHEQIVNDYVIIGDKEHLPKDTNKEGNHTITKVSDECLLECDPKQVMIGERFNKEVSPLQEIFDFKDALSIKVEHQNLTQANHENSNEEHENPSTTEQETKDIPHNKSRDYFLFNMRSSGDDTVHKNRPVQTELHCHSKTGIDNGQDMGNKLPQAGSNEKHEPFCKIVHRLDELPTKVHSGIDHTEANDSDSQTNEASDKHAANKLVATSSSEGSPRVIGNAYVTSIEGKNIQNKPTKVKEQKNGPVNVQVDAGDLSKNKKFFV